MFDNPLLSDKIQDVLYNLAITSWWIFAILALLFFVLTLNLFKSRAQIKSKFLRQNEDFEEFSKLNDIQQIEEYLTSYTKPLLAKAIGLYIRRGDIYILQARTPDEDIQMDTRLYPKDIPNHQKSNIRYILSPSQDLLMSIHLKKEVDLEPIRGFLKMMLTHYEKMLQLNQGKDISRVESASKSMLGNVFKFQYGTETFLKFIVSLLFKTTNATGIVMKNKEKPGKKSTFKEPQKGKYKKIFYIRNTPYILELYTTIPLPQEKIVQLGAFLDLAGGYFENIRTNSKMVRNYIEFLRLSNQALEMQSRYFTNHSQKVRLVAIEIAKNLFLDENTIDRIALGAELHDIGMVGKIENFLDESKIDKRELDLIRYHPIVGSVIVEPIDNAYRIAPIIKYHHERFDGTGYPYGLKGDQIPLEAQIVALAEYYVGLTSPRAYRTPKSHEEAVEDIKKQKEKLVSESVTDAFMDAKNSIHKKLELLEIKE